MGRNSTELRPFLFLPFPFLSFSFLISHLSFVISHFSFFNLSHLSFLLVSMKKLQYNLVLLAFSIIFAENIISYGIIRFF